MKRTVIALLTVLGTVGPTMAEDVYYCVEESANGYHFKAGQYQKSIFTLEPFKILISVGHIVLDAKGYKTGFVCQTGRLGKGMSCSDGDSFYFTYNEENGRFVRNQSFGYVRGDGDSVRNSIGTCSKF